MTTTYATRPAPFLLTPVHSTNADKSSAACTSSQIKVMVVDDHPIVLRGIACCLAKAANITIVGEARNGTEAIRLAKQCAPDVVLMDLELPNMNGLALADQFRIHAPKSRIIMLTMHHRSEYIMRAIQSGARGYLLKDRSAAELIQAVEKVHAGETCFSGEVAMVAVSQFVRAQASDSPSTLTPREKEVLVQIAEGLSNKEIACILNLGVRTVETHRERIMRKLNIHSIAGLTRYAIAEGYIPLQAMAAC